MTEATIVGAVAVEVIPSAKGFAAKLAAQVLPGSGALANALSKNFTDGLDKDVASALERGLAKGTGSAKASGAKAGGAFATSFTATVKAAGAALPKLKIRADSSEAVRTVAQLKGLLATLGDTKLGVGLGGEKAMKELAVIRARLVKLKDDAKTPLRLKVDAAEALAKLDAFTAATAKAGAKAGVVCAGAFASSMKATIAAANTSLPAIKVKADSSDAVRSVAAVKLLLDSLGSKSIGIKISDKGALARLEAIRRKLAGIATDVAAPMQLRVDAQAGIVGIESFTAATRKANTATGNLANSVQGRLSSALNALPDPRIDITLPQGLSNQLKRIRQELTDLSGLRVDIDIPFAEMEARTKKLDADIRELGAASGSERARSGLGAALRDVVAINDEIQASRDLKFQIVPKVRPGFVVAELKAALKAAQTAIGDGIEIPLHIEAGRSALAALLADVSALHERVDVDLSTAEAMVETAALGAALHALGDNVDFSAAVRGEAKKAAAALEQGLGKINTTIAPTVDEKPAVAQLGAFGDRVKAIVSRINANRVTVTADTGPAQSKMDKLARRAAALGDVDFTVAANTAAAKAEITDLARDVRRLGRSDVSIDVKANAKTLLGDLRQLGQALDGIGEDGSKAMASLGRSLIGASPQAAVANISILALGAAIAGLLPIVVPVAAVIPGVLVAIGSAAGIAALGVGALALTFGTLSKGLQALHASQDAAKQTAKDSIAQDVASAGAKRAVANAAKGVAAAQTNAAASIASAMRAERDAGKTLAAAYRNQKDALATLSEAQRSQRQAQLKLTEARAEAKRTLEDLNDAVRSAALAQRSANQDVIDGRLAYNKVLADPTATDDDKQRALNSYQEQQDALIETTKENRRAKEDAAKANKIGVAGVDAVISAQEALRNSIRAVAGAQRGVTDAAEATIVAQENVALAAQATAKAQVDAAESIVAAQQAVVDAENALKVAIAAPPPGPDWRKGLTKQEQDMVLLLDQKLVPAWKRFKAALTAPIISALPGLIDDLNALEPELKGVATAVGESMGDFLTKLGDTTKTKSFTDFLNWLKVDGKAILDDLGDTFISVGKIVSDTTVAFGPNTKDMVAGLKDMAKKAAEFMEKWLKGEDFKAFLAYMRDNGPKIAQAALDLAVAVGKLAIAFAPLGAIMLTGLVGFLNVVAGFDPLVLGVLAVGLVAVAGALLVYNPIVAIASATTWSLGGAIAGLTLSFVFGAALIVAAIVGIAALLVYAYFKFDWFHKFVDAVWHGIVAGAKWCWDMIVAGAKWLWAALQLAWDLIVAGATGLWDGIRAVFDVIVGGLRWLAGLFWTIFGAPIGIVWMLIQVAIAVAWAAIQVIFTLMQIGFAILAAVFRWVWEHVLRPVFKAVGDYVTETVLPVFKKAWNKIKAAFDVVVDALKWVWNHTLKPVFSAIGSFVTDTVVPAFKKGLDALAIMWAGLKKLIATPIYFVLDTIINHGLLEGFNWVADQFLGKSHPDIQIKIPSDLKKAAGHAKGTVLPGYAPGKDVVPAMLSPGEGVLVPQAVRQLGASTVLDWNARALRGEPIHRVRYFAGGGLVGSGPGTFPFMKNWLGSHHSRAVANTYQPSFGYHRGNRNKSYAADITAPDMVTVARGIRAAFKTRIKELIHTPLENDQVWNGKDHTFSGSALRAAHYNHIHWAMLANGVGDTGAGAGDGEDDSWFSLAALVRKIREKTTDGIAKLKEKLGDNALGKMLLGVPEKLITFLKDVPAKWIREKAAQVVAAAKTAGTWVADLFSDDDEKSATTGHAAGNKASPGVAQAYAKGKLSAFGWGPSHWESLKPLWTGESNWRWNAENPDQYHAYGIPQSLPGSKMAAAGADWKTNAFTQIDWGLNYIKGRADYGNPTAAYNKWLARDPHWYDQGGYIPPGVSLVRNDTGKPEAVLNEAQWNAMMAGRDTAGHLSIGVRVHDGAVAGLVSAHVDEQLGALADAHVYGS